MPLYEYFCNSCSETFEIIQKFSDPSVSDCPKCGTEASRQVSRTSFQLKGSGWYATDYKKSSGGSSTPPSDGGGTKSE